MRHHQDHDPYGETEQYDRRINSRDRPHERCHALAAPESRENGEDVSEHGGEYGDDLDIYQPHIVDVGVVFEDLGQCDRDESLEEIQQKDRQGCRRPSTRSMLVVPAFLLPCSRMSMP